ncbi:MAG TPA: RdgB/HAM1 family non-canonical purine NTP pyrophosphatase [Burkholderiaceae bacterium]|nr:RdgB/HAM1 family non-canonical purine NTP pyrophosphatase [Burkholderiaceae bacterium]
MHHHSLVDQTVVLASGNPGKLKEFSAILSQAGIHMVPQDEYGVSPADEPYDTFVENALAKARHAARETGLPALADDSGLCVPALGLAPGVHSARYAAQGGQTPSDASNNQYLIRQLADHDNRQAWYVAVLVLMQHALDPCPIIVERRWYGEIIDTARGDHGFGYDPHFHVPELGLTVAQMEPAIKNRHSHRGRALQALLEQLE